MKRSIAVFGFLLTMHCMYTSTSALKEGDVRIDYGISARKGRYPAFQNTYMVQTSDDELSVSLFGSTSVSGITAVTASVTGQKNGNKQVQFAWAGDSRAILLNKEGELLAQTMGLRPKKMLRTQSCPDFARRIEVEKDADKRLSLPQALMAAHSLLPEIISYPLQPGFEGFIILANNDVWNMFSNQVVARSILYTKKCLEQRDDAAFERLKDDSTASQKDGAKTREIGSDDRTILLARTLRDLVYCQDSFDNITAVVIRLMRK